MSLINTYKQEIRTSNQNHLGRDEWRFTRYGLLEAVKEMTASPESIVSMDVIEQAKQSEGTALKIPTFKIGQATISNVRSCNIGGTSSTTELTEVTFATISADLMMQKAVYDKNSVTFLSDFNHKMMVIENAFAKAIEGLIYTKLDTEKSSVNGSTLIPTTYPVTANVLQVASAQQEHFFNDLSTVMAEDDFYSERYKVLGSTSLQPSVNRYINQGSGNNENLNYQFAGFDFRFSNNLTVGTGKRASGFVMKDGSVVMVSRIGADSLAKTKTKDTDWDTTMFKSIGLEVGTMTKSNCADLSAQTGYEHLTATAVERHQFSVDIGFVTPYNSDKATKAGGIKKFDFL